jgi:hypothetical protein
MSNDVSENEKYYEKIMQEERFLDNCRDSERPKGEPLNPTLNELLACRPDASHAKPNRAKMWRREIRLVKTNLNSRRNNSKRKLGNLPNLGSARVIIDHDITSILWSGKQNLSARQTLLPSWVYFTAYIADEEEGEEEDGIESKFIVCILIPNNTKRNDGTQVRQHEGHLDDRIIRFDETYLRDQHHRGAQ